MTELHDNSTGIFLVDAAAGQWVFDMESRTVKNPAGESIALELIRPSIKEGYRATFFDEDYEAYQLGEVISVERL